MLKLFHTPGTCALASLIALEEAGAGFEKVRVNFKTDDQKKPEFLAVNPKGRVPALVTDQGVLTETPAILTFIAQEFPDAGLAPNGDCSRMMRGSSAVKAPGSELQSIGNEPLRSSYSTTPRE